MQTLFEEKPMTAELVDTRQALPQVELNPLIILDRALERGIPPVEMYALVQQWEQDRAAEAFANALATFQSKCPQIVKRRSMDLGGGKGPLYASLDDIHRQIAPLLAECGLSVTFSASITDAGHVTAKCLIHHGRHVEHSEITLPVPTSMRVNDTQKMGAALSYAKRYALCAALNIVVTDEDNDAGRLSATIDDEQLATINEWIELMGEGFKLKPFLKWLAIDSLAEIPAESYLTVITELQRKAKSLGVTK